MVDRYESIYKDAIKLIEKHNTRDPELILKERNVHLLPFTGETHALGMYVVIKRNSFVFYNPSIDDDFKRMMFAHELGHDLYHKQEAKKGLSEFTLFDVKSSLEYEANLFASHLLLDEEEIIDYGKMGYDLEQIAQNMGVNVNLLLFKFYGMNKLGYDFNLDRSLDRKFFKDIDGKK
jgi:Zn-dependent peptidase ImmA (M78 family)